MTENGLAGQELVVLEGPLEYGVADHQYVVLPSVGQVGRHAARAHVVEVEAKPGRLLKEGQDEFAFAQSVDHHGGRAQVHAVGRHPHQVRGHAVEFAHHHADPDGAIGYFDAQQLFDGHGVAEFVDDRA